MASSSSPETKVAWSLAEIGCEWNSSWDALVANCPQSGFMQSSSWASFKRLEGFLTPRYGLFNEGTLAGGAMLLDFPSAGAEGMLICPEGPVLPWESSGLARDGLRHIIRAAEQRSRLSGGLGLRIEPRLPLPKPAILRNWTRSPVDLNPAHSLIIDLARSEDTVLAQMMPKGRYNIRVAEKHGVTVCCSSQMRDIQSFYTLFAETALRNGFFAEPYSFFLNLGSTLFPARMSELFFANWNGQILAAIMVVYFGKRATFLYGGSSALHRNVMPTYALHWRAMQAARARCCTEYDLYGFDPFEQPDHPYAGFSRFKRQFGGNRFDAIGAHDLIFYDRLADRVIERLVADI